MSKNYQKLPAGSKADDGYTDEITAVSSVKLEYGTFVSLKKDNNVNYIANEVGDSFPEGMVCRASKPYLMQPMSVEPNNCITVLRNGRAWALVDKDYRAEVGSLVKINKKGIIANDGDICPFISVMSKIEEFNGDKVVLVQIDSPRKVPTPPTPPTPPKNQQQ